MKRYAFVSVSDVDIIAVNTEFSRKNMSVGILPFKLFQVGIDLILGQFSVVNLYLSRHNVTSVHADSAFLTACGRLDRNGYNLTVELHKILRIAESFIVFVDHFRRQALEILRFIRRVCQEKLTGNDIDHMTSIAVALVINGAVEGHTVQLAFLITDDGDLVIKGHILFNIPSDKTLHLACKDVGRWTNSSMSKEDKLKVCFDSIKTDYLEGVRHNPPYREDDWPVVCANDIFVYGKGDCYSYGAAFAYVGRAIGYTESYAVNSGGHGWAEINGLIYDPEWSMHSNKSTYFGLSYDDKVDVPYASAISDGAEWKRKKIYS